MALRGRAVRLGRDLLASLSSFSSLSMRCSSPRSLFLPSLPLLLLPGTQNLYPLCLQPRASNAPGKCLSTDALFRCLSRDKLFLIISLSLILSAKSGNNLPAFPMPWFLHSFRRRASLERYWEWRRYPTLFLPWNGIKSLCNFPF